MLTISHAQMERISDAMKERFVSRLCVALRAAYGQETEWRTDANLRDFARSSMKDAFSYGLNKEAPVADFVGLAVQLGAAFHEHPLVFNRLVADDLPLDERVAALFTQLSEDEWTAVATFAAASENAAAILPKGTPD